MKYTIKKINLRNNQVIYVPIFEDESLRMLGEFLMIEVMCFRKDIIKIIDKAKNISDKIEFSGNSCLLVIENGMANIECTIDDAEVGNPVSIKVEEFIQVVESWLRDTQ